LAKQDASNKTSPVFLKTGRRILIMPIAKFSVPALALFLFSAFALTAGSQEQPKQPQELKESQQTLQDAQDSQSEFEINVPTGTVIPIILTAYLNSRSSQVGDTVYSETAYPIWIQQRLVIPKGSTIRGTITEVVRPGRIKGKGRIAIRFDDILLPNGVKREMVASFRGIHGPGEETLDRKSETVSAGASKGSDVGTIAGTTATGAGIGAIAGGGKGAGIGAAVGGAAGLAEILLSRGKDIVLSPGTQFDLELHRAMTFSFTELEFSDSQLRNVQREFRAAPASNNPQSPLGRNRPFGIPF
jgi:hypothetical protein